MRERYINAKYIWKIKIKEFYERTGIWTQVVKRKMKKGQTVENYRNIEGSAEGTTVQCNLKVIINILELLTHVYQVSEEEEEKKTYNYSKKLLWEWRRGTCYVIGWTKGLQK